MHNHFIYDQTESKNPSLSQLPYLKFCATSIPQFPCRESRTMNSSSYPRPVKPSSTQRYRTPKQQKGTSNRVVISPNAVTHDDPYDLPPAQQQQQQQEETSSNYSERQSTGEKSAIKQEKSEVSLLTKENNVPTAAVSKKMVSQPPPLLSVSFDQSTLKELSPVWTTERETSKGSHQESTDQSQSGSQMSLMTPGSNPSPKGESAFPNSPSMITPHKSEKTPRSTRYKEVSTRIHTAFSKLVQSSRSTARPFSTSCKAGIFECDCSARTAYSDIRQILEREYYGVITSENTLDFCMRVPLAVASKLMLLNIVVTVECRGYASRICLRRSMGDAIHVRIDDFEWFCFGVYRHFQKIRHVARPFYP